MAAVAAATVAAPSILAERADEFFDLGGGEENKGEKGLAPEASGDVSPYMLLVGPVRDAQIEGEGLERLASIDSAVPAVTHVDGSARVQTVTKARNGIYYDLLKAFEMRTGCPVLVNTSFNVRGEPIVGSPADAVRVFRRTHMDALVIGRHVITKAAMPESEREAFTPEEIAEEYGLD